MEIDPVAPTETKAVRRLKVALQTRQLEIELFWRRALFFWLFVAAAFAAFASVYDQSPGLSLVVSAFAMVSSLAWSLANRGSKYWQESWEQKLEDAEDDVTGPMFKIEEPVQSYKGKWLRARRYSVSKLAIAVTDYVLIIWVLLFLSQVLRIFVPLTPSRNLGRIAALTFSLFSAFFLLLLVWKGRTSERPSDDGPA